MNNLIAMSSEMTMGTREIAGMLGARHADIIKSVCRLHDAGAICHDTTLPFREFKTERGNTYIEYMLNKLDSITLVAQNSPQFTAALVKRWDELERGVVPQIPQTYAAALLEAGRLAMELEQSQAQLAIAAPKADVFDRVIERDTLLNATQVAQQIGMSAIKMNRKLDELGGVYNKCVKRGRAFCHDWVLSGYGEMKITEMGYPQPLFTTKGSLRVAEIFTSEGVV
jgi:phage regulator Rha-like protein